MSWSLVIIAQILGEIVTTRVVWAVTLGFACGTMSVLPGEGLSSMLGPSDSATGRGHELLRLGLTTRNVGTGETWILSKLARLYENHEN